MRNIDDVRNNDSLKSKTSFFEEIKLFPSLIHCSAINGDIIMNNEIKIFLSIDILNLFEIFTILVY